MYEKAADHYKRAGIKQKELESLKNGKLFNLLVQSLHEY